ncbi:MAG: signal peptidase I [Clostridia bacterium]
MKGRSVALQSEHKRARAVDITITLAVVCVALLFTFLVWLVALRVDDEGMAPTIRNGDVVFFNKLDYFMSAPKRGDIVAYRDGDAVHVGRVVALPGETVCADGGNIYIDGMLLNESVYTYDLSPDIQPIVLDTAKWFIMPDDRANMCNTPQTMIIPINRIIGSAMLRVSPIDRFGIFE